MRKIIGIGETILDIIFRNNQPSHAVPGGSTFNTLISLGRLGVPATLISEIGKDTVGDIIIDFMKKNGVCTENLDIFCEGKTPISLAFLDENNEARYMFYNQFPEERLNFVWPRIEKDDIIIFGSYFALNPALRKKVCELVEFAKERKAIIYYDPNFICTLGSKGVKLFCEKGDKHFATTPVTPVSTIGAGDSFNAGVLFGLLKHDITLDKLYSLTPEEWEPIVRYGREFAATVCCSMDNYITPEFAANYITPE